MSVKAVVVVMNTVRLLSCGTHRGLQIVLNDDIKTPDASAMYCFPSSSATDDESNTTLSSPNLTTGFLQFMLLYSMIFIYLQYETFILICIYFIVVIIVGLGQSDPYCPQVNRQTSIDSLISSISLVSF